MKEIIVEKKDMAGKIISSETIEIVNSISCNRCAQEVWKLSADGNRIEYAEWFETTYHWGYNSPYDLEEHEWHLCSKCYKEITDSFKLPHVISSHFPMLK